MDVVVLVLVVLNAVLTVGVLILVLARRGGSGTTAGAADIAATIRAELQQQSSQIRQEQQEQRLELSQMIRVSSESQATELTKQLTALREGNEAKLEKVREAVGERLQGTLKVSLDENAKRIQTLTDANTAKQEELRRTLSQELEKMRQGNEAKLEKMRETVDEKLQGTLEKRLGESFSLVSERLEQVQKGLGEMQTLASDVGGLKRVLTNVKSRGGWGEVQLARQLEDVLTPEQYAENVATIPGSGERVEFAVKLPGAGEGEQPVWLPIDSKFPQEDYERLLSAQEAGDPIAIEAAGKDIERAVLAQAKTIASKYVDPPHTTDFGIMYLPTEGLFAEVMRRPGFASRLQNEHRIAVVGPTTLMSLLNSLQMGFRTLAIEKRSSEVWKVLSAAKAEFQKYGAVWEKLGKQLQTAQNTVSEAGRRTRVLQKKLSGVESLEVGVGDGAGALMRETIPELGEVDSAVDSDVDVDADDDIASGVDVDADLLAEASGERDEG